MEAIVEEKGGVEAQRGHSMPGRLAPLQVPEPEPEEGKPMGPGFWLGGQGAWEVGQEPPTREKAQGKVPTVQPPPLETDEELAWQLQQEEVAAQQVQWGQDAATLVVEREATGPLMQGQQEGLGGPSKVAGPSKPPTAVVVQLPVVIATQPPHPSSPTVPAPPFPSMPVASPQPAQDAAVALLPVAAPAAVQCYAGQCRRRTSRAVGGAQAAVAQSWRGGW